MNIAVAGTGYVGLSLAVLLSQHNHVTAVDIVPEKDGSAQSRMIISRSIWLSTRSGISISRQPQMVLRHMQMQTM